MFSDSPIEVDLVWFPAAEGAEPLPFPSLIQSLDWDAEPWIPSQVGEVYGANRTYNSKPSVPYLVDLEPCASPETFATGESYNPTLPPTRYNEDQIPICCIDAATVELGLTVELAQLVTRPGEDCATAVPTFVGYTTNQPRYGIQFSQWFRVEVQSGVTYRFDTVWTVPPVFWVLYLYWGTSCEDLALYALTVAGPCVSTTAPGDGYFWLQAVGDGTDQNAISVTPQIGSC